MASHTNHRALPGYCAVTNNRHKDSCRLSERGTWDVPNSAHTHLMDWCVQRCLECDHCRYVSFSKHLSDCSWYRSCGPQLRGGIRGFRTVAVRPALGAPPLLPAAHKDEAEIHCTGEALAQPPSLPALVISGSPSRFERAAAVVRRMGFAPSLSQAVFAANGERTSDGGGARGRIGSVRLRNACEGNNGHREAMRRAWATIASANRSMGVFEDDVAAARGCGARDVRRHIDEHMAWADVVFLGACVTDFYCTHAQFVTPRGAAKLLSLTSGCIERRGESVDQLIQPACNANTLLCAHAPELRDAASGKRIAPGECAAAPRSAAAAARCFGFGLFLQDRVGVAPYLHDASNTAIGVK
jgi:hypothetical protein